MRPSRLAPAVLALSLATLAGLPSPAAAQDAPPAAPKDPPIPADVGETVTTASGLKYSVLVAGKPDGKKPRTGDKVRCHYTGWRTDGKVFDASARHGGPATFDVGGLIAGWNEALQLMTPGAKWKLTIPPEIGYGASGAGPDIPGNSTLIFELELLEVFAMPVFTAPVAAAQKATASGLKYEVLAAGSGEPATAADSVELRYALWNASGTLLDCTEKSGAKIQGKSEAMRFAFLKEAAALMPKGARWRLEVPPALAFGEKAMGPDLPANSTTVWELEVLRVVRPLAVPAFVMPADDKLTTTASGLRYEVVREGSGTAPKRSDTVAVHYAGWLTDGTLFDNSFERGFETTFPLTNVIPGWTEGLQLMKPGAVYRFVIPANLAYGARAMGDKIKPNSTLVFQVELLRVE